MRQWPKAPPTDQPEELMSIIPKPDIWDFANKYGKLAHFLIFVSMPDEGAGKGMIVKPVQIGEYTPQQFRKMLKRLAIKPKEAKLLGQLYAAATHAANAKLYTPAPPARIVSLEATRQVPWPDEWTRI